MEKNNCIKCDINQCKHHYKAEDYCSLEQIQVGTHEKNPTVVECTDCKSFILD